MPKLWDETIETHRRAVRDATLDATAELVDRHGLRGVTMSQIAEETGIGRATLYKYFRDVETILREWHTRRMETHRDQLERIQRHARDPRGGLRAMLVAMAGMSAEGHSSHVTEIANLLHHEHGRGGHEHGRGHGGHDLHATLEDALAKAAAAGVVRADVPPRELATFCINALGAAGGLDSQAAIERLVSVTLDALRADAEAAGPGPPDRSRETPENPSARGLRATG